MEYLDRLLEAATDAGSKYIATIGTAPAPAVVNPSPQIIYQEPAKPASKGKMTGVIIAGLGLAAVVGAFFLFKKKGK